MTSRQEVRGRLVIDDEVVVGTLTVEGGRIASVEAAPANGAVGAGSLPFIAPGFIDVHVHGWGGHDAMGSPEELDGMARALLRRGVTSFLPTAVTRPLADLHAFADRVRGWVPRSPDDGAEPLGFNLEGPFLALARRGAHDASFCLSPADVPRAELEPLLHGLRLTTIAPELAGAWDLIAWLSGTGVAVALGHSAASLDEARAGYAAGATSTTHLFNAMAGIDHRTPGLAVAALTDDAVFVELIADGHHVDRALWPIVTRTKPAGRLVLVSDAIPAAGTGDGRSLVGGLECVVKDGRATLAGTTTLAGSVIALDDAVRNLAGSGTSLPAAITAASATPAALLGLDDRGRLAPGLRADLVELGPDLRVRRTMRAGSWFGAAS